MQVYVAYLNTIKAKSWPSGADLIDATAEGVGSSPVVRQVFSRTLPEVSSVPADRFNSPANYVVLRQTDDSVLGPEAAIESWKRMKPSQRAHASVQYCFSASEQLLLPQNMEDFLNFRAAKLADCLNEFIGLG